jgi:uncharacterized protein
MKFQLDKGEGRHYIQYYQADKCICVNQIEYPHSLILTAHHIAPWSAKHNATLTAADFTPLFTLHPHFVLFGSGKRHQFPHPDLLTDFYTTGTAIEIMATDAACRTFNVLMAENRAVVAALLL